MSDKRPITSINTDDFFDNLVQVDFPPEKRLLIAIIQRALLDYTAPEKGKAHWQYDAGAWLFSASRTPFSLFWVCEALSLENPDCLQKRIQGLARSRTMRVKTVIMRVETK